MFLDFYQSKQSVTHFVFNEEQNTLLQEYNSLYYIAVIVGVNRGWSLDIMTRNHLVANYHCVCVCEVPSTLRV